MKTQNERLLKVLKTGASVTPFYAASVLAVGRLASRILELKQAGEDIASEYVTVQNKFGEPCRVKRYWINRTAA